MDTITLRPSAAHLARSRAVIIGVIFLVVLAPILLGLLCSARAQADPTLESFYLVATAAPATGMLLSLIMLAVVLHRRSRPTLRIDDRVTLPRTGVTFPLSQLSHIQLYSRPGRGTFLVLLPAHVPERVGRSGEDTRALAPYTVRFPEGATPQPFDLVDLIRARVPEVGVDKLGTVRSR